MRTSARPLARSGSLVSERASAGARPGRQCAAGRAERLPARREALWACSARRQSLALCGGACARRAHAGSWSRFRARSRDVSLYVGCIALAHSSYRMNE